MHAIVSLSGFPVCPFQLILDINQQLPQPHPTLAKRIFVPICELNTTNDWINLEALGNPVALRAREWSDALALLFQKQGIRELELEIDLQDAPFTIDNLFSLLFMADSLQHLNLIFYVNAEQIASVLDSLLPLQSKSSIHIQLKTENLHSDRMQQLKTQRATILQARGVTVDDEWLAQNTVTIQHFGMFIGYAWACLKAGAYEPGCRILEHILSQPRLHRIVYEQLFMHLQLIRFLSHQYEKVCDAVFPENFEHLEEKDAINLYFIKAYAATLTRNLAVAETWFKKSGVNASLPMTDEVSLFRLNLHALFLVLQGEIDTALNLELQIKDFIAQNHIDVLGLKYVNFINIARVYKKLNQFDISFSYYEKAYQELRGGGFTASDHIYYNMNIASLHEGKGEYEQALYAWIRVALHWLCFSNPHALAWRPRLILCQEKMRDILQPLVQDKVHQFLLDKISGLLQIVQPDWDLDTPVHVNFVKNAAAKKQACYLAQGIILYQCQTEEKTQTQSDVENALRDLLAKSVKHIFSIREDNLCVLVDNSLENIYPVSAQECLKLALVTDCPTFYYEGQTLQFHAREVEDFLKHSTLKLSRMLHSIKPVENGLQLGYHRSFLNKKLHTQDEIRLVQRCHEQKVTEALALQSGEMGVLRNLVAGKVLVLV